MKKIITLLSAILLISCGGGNSKVENLVLEELQADGVDKGQIESITSEPTDSVITPVIFGFLSNDICRAVANYTSNKISKDSCDKVFDNSNRRAEDIIRSYKFGIVVNDSLRSIYDQGDWRKAYKVTVKMKSGLEQEIKVITDTDGETPSCTEREFMKQAQDYQNLMLKQLELTY